MDNALLQFAGEIGFLSAGLEKRFSRYRLGGLYGIVPTELSRGPLIETITLRQTYSFYSWEKFDFYGGLNIFHVLGLDYQTEKFRDAPRNYYSIGSIRGLLNLGFNLSLLKDRKQSFYFEMGLNDISITNYLTNSREVNPSDHVSLGMGYKYGF